MRSFVLIIGSLAAATATAHAGSLPVNPDARLQLGANATYTASAYDVDNEVSVLPQGFYDNNRWYLEGSEGGFYPYKDDTHHVRLGLSYDGRSFDPRDANQAALRQLDERQWSALAHASYMYISPVGAFKLKVATDALGRHEGTVVTASYLARFDKDNLTIYPSAGVIWANDNYNDYYYGMGSDESVRTGLKVQQIEAGVSPFVSAMATYRLSDHFSLFAHQNITWLSSEQKASQLVDGSVHSTSRLGLNYTF